MLIYRLAAMPHKRIIYMVMSILSAGAYVAFSALLDPSLGADGQGIAMGLTYALTGAIVIAVSQLGRDPLPIETGRLVAAVALAAACELGFHRLAMALPEFRVAVKLAGIATYLLGLVVCRILTADVVRALIRAVGAMLPHRGAVNDVQSEIAQLEPPTGPRPAIARPYGRPPGPRRAAWNDRRRAGAADRRRAPADRRTRRPPRMRHADRCVPTVRRVGRRA